MKNFSFGLILMLCFSCSCFGEESVAEMYNEEAIPHDQETQVFFDGSRYIGQFKDGTAHGRGTITFSDGSIYTGQFQDGEISGNGTMVFPDGSEYVGQFKDGMIHGQGSITFPDGSTYEGHFVDNKYHGEGVWSTPYGITYAGQFKAGKFDGQGTYSLPDGSRYVGMFKDDYFQGGKWEQAQGSESRFENVSLPLEPKEHAVETKPADGFVSFQVHPDSSAIQQAGMLEETMAETGGGTSFKNASDHAFSVQAGAFVSRTNAERLAATLRDKGYAAIILPMTDYYGRSWYAVRLGSYSNFEEAKKEASAFSEKENLTATVRPVNAL